jgi:hypothetical protein
MAIQPTNGPITVDVIFNEVQRQAQNRGLI